MAYQPRARTPRGFSRRPEKARPKTRTEKPRPSSSHIFMEEHVPTCKEVVDRTLNSLRGLGSQRFAVPPFSEHFHRWILNLRGVMSEFESRPQVKADDQFREECTRILSDIDLALRENQAKEASVEKSIREVNQELIDARNLLAQNDRQYASKIREIAKRKDLAVKPVVSKLGALKEELNRLVRMRTGFLRSVLKAGARKEAETTHELDFAKGELATIEESFATEQERLLDEHERRRQQILERIANHQKEMDAIKASSEVNDAVELREAACNTLIDAVNALLRRTEPALENATASP